MPELSSKPRIALGSDHAGFSVNGTIRQFLENAGYLVDGLGTWSKESVDYPDYGKAVGDEVAAHHDKYGIAVGGTGIGISIAANKVPGIRAAVAHDLNTARLAREHRVFGGRHQQRIQKIALIEREQRAQRLHRKKCSASARTIIEEK